MRFLMVRTHIVKAVLVGLAVAFVASGPAASAADHALRPQDARHHDADRARAGTGSPMKLFREFLHWLEHR
jgi:hypothetical protein